MYIPWKLDVIIYGCWKIMSVTLSGNWIGGFSENPWVETNTPSPPGPLNKNSSNEDIIIKTFQYDIKNLEILKNF